jgi:hypothetical protein
MKLSETPPYAKAIAALQGLKGQLGVTPELQAIASFLISAADAETAGSMFPYVGDQSDPRDVAVVQAHLAAWADFLAGEDVVEQGREL